MRMRKNTNRLRLVPYLPTNSRAGLGAIPVAGAAATELLNAIVIPPLEKRP